MTEPLRLAVIGAGQRGRHAYAAHCLRHRDEARVVAVADPVAHRRDGLGVEHGIPPELRFATWEQLLDTPVPLDGVIVATPDPLHLAPALRALELGHDILLEKPVAPDEAGVLTLAEAAASLPGRITVAHVLRHTPFFATIKRLLEAGRVGRVMSIQYSENIGYWHFAHSYVRGNWRSAATSSPMILAKSCHDMDMLRWLIGRPWESIASFGELSLFTEANAPRGAPERCTQGCPAGESCQFNAVTLYVETLEHHTGWPVSVITEDLSRAGRLEALKQGPYGRCVYRCDNDAVDHQVAIVAFDGGATATLNVCGTTAENTRTLKVMGSSGEIRGHLESGEIELRSFCRVRPSGPGAEDARNSHGTEVGFASETRRVAAGEGHGGGDAGLMHEFVRRARLRKRGDQAPEALTSLAESLEGHLMAFAAEESRLGSCVVRSVSSRS